MSLIADLLLNATKNPKFEIHPSVNGWQYYWVFKATNGEKLCTSEMYNSRQAAENGINSLITNIKSHF